MNNLKVIDSYFDNGEKVYYISRINERLSWPPNATLAVFVNEDKKLKKYKVLEVGDNNIKVVVIKQ